MRSLDRNWHFQLEPENEQYPFHVYLQRTGKTGLRGAYHTLDEAMNKANALRRQAPLYAKVVVLNIKEDGTIEDLNFPNPQP
jgi:hypothetical protein